MGIGELRSAYDSSSEYHLIHKHLVGPKTAERLMRHYIELTQSQSIERMYEAGWAATEAALVAKDRPHDERLEMLQAGDAAWEYSHELAMERQAERQKPAYIRAFRIETTRSALPVLETIVTEEFSEDARKVAFESLLKVAAKTLEHARQSRQENSGHFSGYCGLHNEQLGQLAIDRNFASNTFATTSLARSDSGVHYPRATHDIQVLPFYPSDDNSNITPIEVKTKSSRSSRYQSPVLSAKHHLQIDDLAQAFFAHELFEKEFYHPEALEVHEATRLSQLTDAVTERIDEYHNKRLAQLAKTALAA